MIEIPGLLLTLDMFLYLLEPPFPHLEIKGDNAYYQEAADGFLEVVQLDPGLVPIEVGNVLTNFLCHFRCSNSKLKLVSQGQRRGGQYVWKGLWRRDKDRRNSGG